VQVASSYVLPPVHIILFDVGYYKQEVNLIIDLSKKTLKSSTATYRLSLEGVGSSLSSDSGPWG
jgi:hypothetical protein